MNLKSTFIITLLTIFFGCGNSDIQKEYFEDGIRYKEYFNERTNTSLVKSYYHNDQIRSLFSRVDNKLSGQYLGYDTAGELIDSGYYENNLLEGEFKTYYSEGVLKARNNFLEGKREGYQYGYSPDGRISIINYCINDSAYYKKNLIDENLVKVLMTPSISLLTKKEINRSDTLNFIIEFKLPEELFRNKELFAFIDIGRSLSTDDALEYPRDSFLIRPNTIYRRAFKIHEKQNVMLYGFVGDRKSNRNINYEIFELPLKFD